jgi:hypothetical protein
MRENREFDMYKYASNKKKEQRKIRKSIQKYNDGMGLR